MASFSPARPLNNKEPSSSVNTPLAISALTISSVESAKALPAKLSANTADVAATMLRNSKFFKIYSQLNVLFVSTRAILKF